MAATTPDGNKKSPTVFKKVLKYFQDQAVEQSTSRSTNYLSPPGKEPQQKLKHRPRQNQQPITRELARTFSDATTAVEPRQPRGTRHSSFGISSRTTLSVSQNIKKIQYAHENLLQGYELYVPESLSQELKEEGYWIIYIHGGYFRDPKIDASSFRPALDLLTSTSTSTSLPSTIAEESESSSLNSSSADQQHRRQPDFTSLSRTIHHHIAGYASLNYRLSAHPAHPQDPATTPKYELRTAQYPDQINDIITAIKHLQSRHGFGSKYILAGHSVGATLAYLAALRAQPENFPPPTSIVGLNGIYSFPGIHTTNPEYEPMTRCAMTPSQYREASPALYPPEDWVEIATQASTPTSFILAHSRDDGLVGWEQVEGMKDVLDLASTSASTSTATQPHPQPEIVVRLVETKGAHDSIWADGSELARVLREVVGMVVSS